MSEFCRRGLTRTLKAAVRGPALPAPLFRCPPDCRPALFSPPPGSGRSLAFSPNVLHLCITNRPMAFLLLRITSGSLRGRQEWVGCRWHGDASAGLSSCSSPDAVRSGPLRRLWLAQTSIEDVFAEIFTCPSLLIL